MTQLWKPVKEQIQGVEFLLGHACAGVLLDPGTFGKTSIALEATRILLEMGLVKHVLIFAPLRVCQIVWPLEIEKWSNFNHITYRILHGKDKEKNLTEDVNVYITNYDSMAWLFGYKNGRIDPVRIAKFDMVILDELSKFKNYNTARFKMMKQAVPYFKRRYGLTGTPTPRSYENLFGQCYVLDEGNALGKYITHYRNQYFIQHHSGFGYDLRPGAKEEIHEKIRPLMFRKVGNSGEMPRLIESPIYIKLDKATLKICTDMQKDLLAVDKALKASIEWAALFYEDLLGELPDNAHIAQTYAALQKGLQDLTLTAANKAVALQKCKQIASGAIYIDAKRGQTQHIHNFKLDALCELIEELQGQPLLVIYEFRHELERIQARLGGKLPYVGSGVSEKEVVAIEKAWNAGDIPILLGHPAAMGYGLNLQGSGNKICWFSLTRDYELWDQTVRRLLRRGLNHEHVTVYILLAEDTIDMFIYEMDVKQKGATQDQLLAAMVSAFN